MGMKRAMGIGSLLLAQVMGSPWVSQEKNASFAFRSNCRIKLNPQIKD